jgi:hypothetical protein
MYKILRSIIEDNGSDPDGAIESAILDLATQVDQAESEGWTVAGGLQTHSRVLRGIVIVWMMQAMTAPTVVQVEGLPEEAILRHSQI